jgi:hypothetical protein
LFNFPIGTVEIISLVFQVKPLTVEFYNFSGSSAGANQCRLTAA